MNRTPDSQPAVLQVLIPGSKPALDVFDVWQGGTPVDLAEGVGTVWRADLPEDVQQARLFLQLQASELHSAERAMPLAGQRLRMDLAALPLEIPKLSTGSAFGNVDNHGNDLQSDPRAVLEAARRYQPGVASFAGGDGLQVADSDLEQMGDRFEQFINQVQRSVGQFAMVETSSSGRPLATSRVDWFGDVETWWAVDGEPERVSLHTSVLNQALLTRQNWLRFALLVTGGAVRVGTALATGPFGLLSIWTTWNYVRRVIDEFRRLPN